MAAAAVRARPRAVLPRRCCCSVPLEVCRPWAWLGKHVRAPGQRARRLRLGLLAAGRRWLQPLPPLPCPTALAAQTRGSSCLMQGAEHGCQVATPQCGQWRKVARDRERGRMEFRSMSNSGGRAVITWLEGRSTPPEPSVQRGTACATTSCLCACAQHAHPTRCPTAGSRTKRGPFTSMGGPGPRIYTGNGWMRPMRLRWAAAGRPLALCLDHFACALARVQRGGLVGVRALGPKRAVGSNCGRPKGHPGILENMEGVALLCGAELDDSGVAWGGGSYDVIHTGTVGSGKRDKALHAVVSKKGRGVVPCGRRPRRELRARGGGKLALMRRPPAPHSPPGQT
jgi:hypothetical protein